MPFPFLEEPTSFYELVPVTLVGKGISQESSREVFVSNIPMCNIHTGFLYCGFRGGRGWEGGCWRGVGEGLGKGWGGGWVFYTSKTPFEKNVVHSLDKRG